MNKSMVMAVLSAAGIASIAQAQNYNFQMRLIPDGAADAPSGSWVSYPQTSTATRIGFWVQARVSQDAGQNWGIGRFTLPGAPNCDFITVTDPTGSTLQRGGINAGASAHGRGNGYRNGGSNVGATGNAAGSAAFPGPTNNENGAIDQGGARIYGMDAYIGFTRTSPTYLVDDGGTPLDPSDDIRADIIDPNTGDPVNPWAVNGGGSPATQANPNPATSVPLNTFSPWANLYRIWLVPTNSNVQRTITLDVSGQLNGTVQASPSAAHGNNWAMQLSPGVTMTATYSFQYGVPTPGAAALMGMGMLAAGRRRR